ncbi:MAG: hypothetical protein PF505_06640, partial [Vallitaleaceae bacterium]|nr:hypothetical protein [Vallitaleaceae bacterium]
KRSYIIDFASEHGCEPRQFDTWRYQHVGIINTIACGSSMTLYFLMLYYLIPFVLCAFCKIQFYLHFI